MPNQVLITCFTDLKDSTAMTENEGHERLLPEIADHLRVGQILAKRAGGNYRKSIGDAHMVTFDYLEHAIAFTVQLQEYYREQPCIRRQPLHVRVGLYLGTVEPIGDDVIGSGANRAARTQSEAAPGEVMLNRELVDQIERVWGAPEVEKYLSSTGEHKLKGIKDPQELFSFDWQQYGYDHPDIGQARLVHEHLRRASVEASMLEPEDLARPGTLIWPVVPRDLLTAIHRGQTEVVKLLALLGWNINLLIADCGARNNYDRTYSSTFSEKVVNYVEGRGVSRVNVSYLSDFFDPTFEGYSRVQAIFRGITADLTLKDLLDINNKEYSDDVKEEIKRSATLDCLRPALSIAAVLYLVETAGQKGIVVAGADEKIQWERAYDIPNTRGHIGVMMNPILRVDPTHQSRQSRNWPSWPSPEALLREMNSNNNLAWWAFNLHAFIPAFPAATVNIGGQEISPQEWTNELVPPENVRREALVEQVWPLLRPLT
jgi:class 3 adenylate cyclase